MDELDKACLDIQEILDDIQAKSEEKRQLEVNAKKVGYDISILKDKILDIIHNKLQAKA